MIAHFPSRKSRRIVVECSAERSARREPASANSLGRVVPAAWTAARLASAASRWGKPAGAGCAPFASAERCGSPGLLNVGRGACNTTSGRIANAFIFACTSTPTDAGLGAAKVKRAPRFTSHSRCRCLVTVFADRCADSSVAAAKPSRAWRWPASAFAALEVHHGASF